jgi:hypothetical protein
LAIRYRLNCTKIFQVRLPSKGLNLSADLEAADNGSNGVSLKMTLHLSVKDMQKIRGKIIPVQAKPKHTRGRSRSIAPLIPNLGFK